ncbi:ABC transporter transmembrane domain-containing protein [Streptomyces halstedii]|uniref:ABC transporter transmembrane domain-containing protein n=1 Tax=Streptomyces TaxID=1883 RepID=UPI0004A94D00|nr:ABC transporter ATP-binding protein [Streptomyces sp. NTK 937]KDQ65838.1 ABC transporter permease [Streptomyces sp. NTK 937]WSX39495.1 ABC transporter ATP-binding protein/permease [Streptomyces halstedii]
MQIRDLPYSDPGDPDVRSGPRFLLWLGLSQLTGQLKALSWGLLHQCAIAGLPLCVGLAVQAVVERSGSGLAWAGALIVALGVLIAVGDTMLHRTAVTNWITAAARVQQLLARKTAELGSALTRRVAAGEVVAVSTGDVEKIGWFVEALSRFAAAAFALVLICVGLVLYLPSLGVLVALAVPVLALAVLPLLPRATRRADAQREKAGHATELASDTVAGLRVLRGIGGEELFLGRYRRASQEVREAAVRSARMWALISAIQVLLPGVLLIALVWYGATLARDGRIEVGQLVTVYSAATLMLFPLRHFEEIAMAYSFSRPSAQRAVRVLSLSRGARTATAGAVVPEGDLYDPVTGLLATRGLFTAVVCGDPDEAGRLADRLGGHAEPDGRAPDEAGADTPTAEAGGPDTKNTQGRDTNGPEKTGPDPSDGGASQREGTGTGGAPGPGEDRRLPSVLLGGVPLDELPLGSARTAVLVQDKDPVLLSGTLRELLDVPSSGAVTAEEALAAAQCADVLDALAQASVEADGDPMDTRITERGRSLSGGQRQRLALARSLVTDPEALVLDEPTSAVDSHTEARVAAGVKRLRSGRTTVAFSSSPLLLDLADRVALVHGGQVVAAGTHRALLRDEARYRAVVTRETDDTAAPAATDRQERLASIDVSRAAEATEEIEERA